ncbi:MAG: hypothetical protein ACFCU6_15075 [Balneolaceae bacterium]
MRKLFFLQILFIGTLFFFSSCSDDVSEIITAIDGIVENSNGDRVSGAKIAITYQIQSPQGPFTTPANGTVLQISVPSNQRVTLRVKDDNNQVVIRTLIDRELQAGQHSFLWDLRNSKEKVVLSGLYFAETEFEDKSESFPFFVNIPNYSIYKFDEISFIATTDQDGRFEIDRDELLFNNVSLGDLNMTLNNQFTIWAIDTDSRVTQNNDVFFDSTQSSPVQIRISF